MNDALRDLFAVPPAEFTAARDALAKELRAKGRDAQAKEVASLRRPTAPVWAVNQLARRAPADVDELLESSERVRHAQVRGAAGDELRAAMAAQRAALAKLEKGAEQVLRGAGLQASPGALRTVQSTLQAAATGPREVREQLRSGTMREALEPTGFEALLGAGMKPARARSRSPSTSPSPSHSPSRSTSHSPSTATPTATPTPTATSISTRRAAAADAKRRAAEAREAQRRSREAARLERRLRQLEARAAAAEQAASKARAAVESARADLQRLRS